MFTIAIHGGAGTLLPGDMSAEKEALYRGGLQKALDIGFGILEKGGSSLDAVTAAVVELENNPLFNAGKGAVFTNRGTHALDASIMEGKSKSCGAVAGVIGVQNPIVLAKLVMEKSGHVFLSGKGAEEFAQQEGCVFQPETYFYDEFRYNQWQLVKDSDRYQLDHTPEDAAIREKKFGTVGAVACDSFGNIAAATSTGGMTNKRFDRVGDTPIIGAGNYANNATCAISCTGHGEKFIQAVAAYDVSCLMEYKGLSLQSAMEEVVMVKLKNIDGEGGMIGVDAKGAHALIFNSEGMYRGVRNSSELNEVKIYR